MFQKLLPPLNSHNLPYPDTIHPIVVHFVIAMVLGAFGGCGRVTPQEKGTR